MKFAPDPVPLAELRLAFAALLARASEIGALVLGSMLDYYLHKKLEKKLAAIIADLRLALLHRAFELVPTLRPYKPKPAPPPPEPLPIDDAAPPEYGDDPDIEPDAAFGQAKNPRPSGVILWPVGLHGQDNSAGRQPFYFLPEYLCTRRLIGRFRAVERMLANIDTYARKLALILARPPLWARRRPDLASQAAPSRYEWRAAPDHPNGRILAPVTDSS